MNREELKKSMRKIALRHIGPRPYRLRTRTTVNVSSVDELSQMFGEPIWSVTYGVTVLASLDQEFRENFQRDVYSEIPDRVVFPSLYNILYLENFNPWPNNQKYVRLSCQKDMRHFFQNPTVGPESVRLEDGKLKGYYALRKTSEVPSRWYRKSNMRWRSSQYEYLYRETKEAMWEE